MFSRFRNAILLVLVFTLAFVIPVFAGGWAVISLDELPTGVVAGEPHTIGFTVLQHGKTPMTGLYPIITARLSNDEVLTFSAEPEGKPGHYTATLTFPQRWGVGMVHSSVHNGSEDACAKCCRGRDCVSESASREIWVAICIRFAVVNCPHVGVRDWPCWPGGGISK